MSNYVILTDSSCDLSAKSAEEWGVVVVPLSVDMGGTIYTNYLDWREISQSDFYNALRGGKMAKTSAPSTGAFVSAMDKALQDGKDVLYVGFSSGLSASYNSGAIAAEEMRAKYPERTIITVDSLSASLGQGMLVWKCVELRDRGKSLQEVANWLEENKLKACHWFTVDDLGHLKRGGRVSATTALVGTMLGIKPVLHVDNAGHLINTGKARGRTASIKALYSKIESTGVELERQKVFISHGDCEKEARYLGDMIREKLHVKEVYINAIGPVIGSHSGPGTIALFFMGTER